MSESRARFSFRRLMNSGVAWTTAFHAVRLLLGLALLPMLLRYLPRPEDLGMFYLFMSLVQMLPRVEAAFSFNVGRQVTFAMGGAVRLLPQGTAPAATAGSPNLALVRQLVDATGVIYAVLSVGVLVVLAIFGTAVVAGKIPNTSNPTLSWSGWILTLAGTVIEIQSLRWVGFLRNMNRVTHAARLGTFAYSGKAILACVCLGMGGGLISVPLAGIFSGLVLWQLARRRCLEHLPLEHGKTSWKQIRELIGVIWPNTWRAGIQIASEYLANVGLMALCSSNRYGLGLAVSAQYGLSLQLLAVVQQVSMVWTEVKWPLAGQLRAQNRLADMRRLLWERGLLQNLTYMLGALVLVATAEPLLRWVGLNKEPLSTGLFALLALNHFLYLRFAFWVYLIATDNRLPFLWPIVLTNIATIGLAFVLVEFLGLGLPAIVTAPLITGALFNYWYWMFPGARELGTTWWQFVRSPGSVSAKV